MKSGLRTVSREGRGRSKSAFIRFIKRAPRPGAERSSAIASIKRPEPYPSIVAICVPFSAIAIFAHLPPPFLFLLFLLGLLTVAIAILCALLVLAIPVVLLIVHGMLSFDPSGRETHERHMEFPAMR